MSLSGKDVTAILQALENSSFDTLDLELDGVKISLRRGQGEALPVSASRRVAGNVASSLPSVASASAVAASAAASAAAVPPGTVPVAAPLLGVFYRAPKPGEPPFVEVGSQVESDSIIGIIEVMKLMNTVRAGVKGEVVAIPGRNGELVEFGEALMHVRPAKP